MPAVINRSLQYRIVITPYRPGMKAEAQIYIGRAVVI
jgi:hypothetical protein